MASIVKWDKIGEDNSDRLPDNIELEMTGTVIYSLSVVDAEGNTIMRVRKANYGDMEISVPHVEYVDCFRVQGRAVLSVHYGDRSRLAVDMDELFEHKCDADERVRTLGEDKNTDIDLTVTEVNVPLSELSHSQEVRNQAFELADAANSDEDDPSKTVILNK